MQFDLIRMHTQEHRIDWRCFSLRYHPRIAALTGASMKTFLVFIVWCILFVLCWPIAVMVLVLFPILWLLSLPFRLVGITFEALFSLLRAILLLPTRILGHRTHSAGRTS